MCDETDRREEAATLDGGAAHAVGRDHAREDDAKDTASAEDSIMDYIPSTTCGEVVRGPSLRGVVVAGGVLVVVAASMATFAAHRMGRHASNEVEPAIRAPERSSARPYEHGRPDDAASISTEAGNLGGHPSVPAGVAGSTSEERAAMPDDGDVRMEEDDIVIFLIEDEDGAAGSADENGGAEAISRRHARRKTRPRGRRSRGPRRDVVYAVLDPAMVRRTIRSRMVQIHRCYDDALQGQPDLAGKLGIHMTIGVTGMVTKVEFGRDTLHHAGVTSCIRARIRRWRFHLSGELREPTEVSFPVVFRS
jgi:hypothetical protein